MTRCSQRSAAPERRLQLQYLGLASVGSIVAYVQRSRFPTFPFSMILANKVLGTHRHEAGESCEGTAVERPGRWRVDASFLRLLPLGGTRYCHLPGQRNLNGREAAIDAIDFDYRAFFRQRSYYSTTVERDLPGSTW